jgi:hypothetical protein
MAGWFLTYWSGRGLFYGTTRAFPGTIKKHYEEHQSLRFQVLKAASMKTAVWDIAPCCLVEVDGRFKGAYWSPW